RGYVSKMLTEQASYCWGTILRPQILMNATSHGYRLTLPATIARLGISLTWRPRLADNSPGMECRMFCEPTMEIAQSALLFFCGCVLNKNWELIISSQFMVLSSRLATLPSPTLPSCAAGLRRSRGGQRCDRPTTAWAQFPKSVKDLQEQPARKAHGPQLL